MKSRRDLRSRARFGIAAIVLVIILGSGALIWQIAESTRARRDLIFQGNEALAKVASVLVAEQVSARLKAVEAVARRPDFVEMVATREWDTASLFLEGLRQLDEGLTSSALLDQDGRLWARHPADASVVGRDFSERDYFRGALSSDSAYMSEVFQQQGTPRAVVVAFAVAVRDKDGTIVGVLQTTLPTAKLAGVASEFQVPYGGSIQLFDQAGHLLTAQLAGDQESFANHPMVATALAGHSASGESAVPGRAGRHLVASAPVPAIGWAVLVEQPRDEALRAVTELTARLLAVGAAIAALGLATAIALIRLIRKLDDERRRASAILDSAAEAIITTDSQGIVTSINPAMEALTGLSENDVKGRLYSEAFALFDSRGQSVTHEKRPLAKAIETRGAIASHGFDLMLQTNDGRRLPVSITAAPILDEQGDPIGGVDVIRDISHEREVDQMKSALISTVSHELRTPLTMIQGFSELLLARDFDPVKSREALEQINSSAERLGRLIDDLLSVSRIEAERLVVRKSRVDLAETIGEVAKHFASEREVRTEIQDGLPYALADRDIVLQIITNLVSNAVKYSPDGSAVVIEAARNGSNMQVSVSDKGIGLTDSEASSLFEKFYRVDRPEVQQAGGTGLGLFITKSLVEMQGGQIWVRSTPGKGSTFAFSLPIADNGEEEIL